jgi:hypothetical protein
MAKKTKKYADGGDIYEGTDLARAMGVRGVPEPGLEAMYPEQYMGGVGSIKGVGGSALKAVAPKKTATKAFGGLEKMTPAQRAAREAIDKKDAADYAKKVAREEKGYSQSTYNRWDKEYRKDQGLPPRKRGRQPEEVMPTQKEMAEKDVSDFLDKLSEERGGYKKGGAVKKMAKGGSVSSASKRGDGCATKGKTRGRMI